MENRDYWPTWWESWPATSSTPVDDDTVVTTTIGKLTAALAEALKDVNVVDEPQWKPGDRACIEVEVTGVHGPNGEHVNYVIAGLTGKRRGGSVPADILEGFEQ